MKRALVCGAGGFIGSHLVNRLKREGFWVRGVDLKYPEFSETSADDFIQGDLRDPHIAREAVDVRFDEIYQLAADMGGAGYIFTGENDAAVMHNSALINLNVLEACQRRNSKRIFYSSSACIYPEYQQRDPNNVEPARDAAYPAAPDSEYGWEKLFSERLYLAFQRNHGFDVHVARYHNIFGPEGAWNNGKEKSPAAHCPQGRDGAGWRQHRDLGRRPADQVVPLHRRMRRGHDPADALELFGPGQHRLRRDGHHQRPRVHAHADRAARSSTCATFQVRSACAGAIPTTR